MIIDEESFPEIQPVLSEKKILGLQKITRHVHLEAKLLEYIVNLISASRGLRSIDLSDVIEIGASPRGWPISS